RSAVASPAESPAVEQKPWRCTSCPSSARGPRAFLRHQPRLLTDSKLSADQRPRATDGCNQPPRPRWERQPANEPMLPGRVTLKPLLFVPSDVSAPACFAT